MREELRAIRLFAAKLGAAMPFWYIISFLLLIAELVSRRSESGYLLLIAASSIWAAVIVLTILFLVPINNRLARVDPDAAVEPALKEHGRWDAMHRWRVATLAVAMVCFLMGCFGSGERPFQSWRPEHSFGQIRKHKLLDSKMPSPV